MIACAAVNTHWSLPGVNMQPNRTKAQAGGMRRRQCLRRPPRRTPSCLPPHPSLPRNSTTTHTSASVARAPPTRPRVRTSWTRHQGSTRISADCPRSLGARFPSLARRHALLRVHALRPLLCALLGGWRSCALHGHKEEKSERSRHKRRGVAGCSIPIFLKMLLGTLLCLFAQAVPSL